MIDHAQFVIAIVEYGVAENVVVSSANLRLDPNILA
jgi:hypothetical protein